MGDFIVNHVFSAFVFFLTFNQIKMENDFMKNQIII